MTTFLRRRTVDRHRASACVAILLALLWIDLSAERLPVRIYTTADGLAHNNIFRIVRDSQGFLWFCTPEGLSRFDGYAFRTFGAAQGFPSVVTDLLETSAGDYWLGTDSGLIHLDSGRIAAASVRRVEPAGPPAFPLIVPAGSDGRSAAVTVLRQTGDATVWVGTKNGLYRLDDPFGNPSLTAVDIGLAREFPEQRYIAALLEDRHGALWIGTPDGLYRRRRDGAVARFSVHQGLPAQYISDLLEDRDGRVWVATRDGGLFRMRPEPADSAAVIDLRFSVAEGLPDPWVQALFQSSDGRLWIGTAKGVAELQLGGARPMLRVYTAQQGLTNGYVGAINEDLGGNVWLGSSASGAFKLTAGGLTTYGQRDGIDSVNSILEDQSGALSFKGVVLGDGVRSVFDGARLDLLGADPVGIEQFGSFDGLTFKWFTPGSLRLWGWVRERVTLQTKNGEWWIGSQEGLFRYPPSAHFVDVKGAKPLAVYKTEHGLPAIQIYRLFEDSRGDVWISTISSPTRGLSVFDRATGRLRDVGHHPSLPSPVQDLVRSFAEAPKGTVWLAFNSGLARYSNGLVTFFTKRDGLPSGPMLDMHVDRAGRLWLASERSGLIRVDNNSGPTPSFVAYGTAQGLSSNSLVAITEDRNGFLYVGGGNGIDRFDPATERVRHFTQADGLNPGLVQAAFCDRNGVLWFGMSNGLARLVPEPEKPKLAPPILISGLRVAGVPFNVSPFGDRHVALRDLPTDDHQLEIEFVGLGFVPGEVLRYQYKLEGAATDWSPLSQRRAITYASLSPGQYTFSVRAVTSEGIVSPSPATLSFRILRPFWQRWWFLAAAALALGVAGSGAYRYRVARLLEVANMRTHIATDLHDDIGANLTRIALLSEVAQRTSEKTALVSIATLARESVTAMSDIVWAINPRREGLLDLTRRMRQHASELFTLRGIALRFDVPAGVESQRLGMDVRRDILLIFKEAVNNAARHSRCTAVEIAVRVERGTLVLSVVDNGVGFDSSIDADGQGLSSMRRRAARIHGSLRIEPATPGTAVTLSVPI